MERQACFLPLVDVTGTSSGKHCLVNSGESLQFNLWKSLLVCEGMSLGVRKVSDVAGIYTWVCGLFYRLCYSRGHNSVVVKMSCAVTYLYASPE